MKKLWLIVAQVVTIAIGLWSLISLLYPTWTPTWRPFFAHTPSPLPPVTANPPETPRALAPVLSYRDAVRRAGPAVVDIFTSKQIQRPRFGSLFEDEPLFRRFFGEPSPEEGRVTNLGAGVIVSVDGYIVTNHHVIEAADEIKIALADGRKLIATVYGIDPDTDLAVLKVKAADLPVIQFGLSEHLSVGDVVLAIGQPFGFGQTVTMGIVSALGRKQLRLNPFEDFIQTDAAINRGNSGGALIDTAGRLVGINVAIFSQSGGSHGVGFAIPVNTVKHVVDQIVQNRSVTRGWMGITVQAVSAELAAVLGAQKSVGGTIITHVLPNSPAEKAGLQAGDILQTIDRRTVTDSSSALSLIAQLKPGSPIAVTVLRRQSPLTLTVKIGKRPGREALSHTSTLSPSNPSPED